ncbi:unnamed protein product [Pneumocystis jirovecii]|uniref:CUE domain-containing protein n=1 Tax=Pneumocystis jirovecii TaxID=42068 RepID=L0P9V2_PNEJI|nr:unnamed protein product [Pneumocystis jirovecii]
MEYNQNNISQDKLDILEHQESINHEDSLSFLKMIFPQQHQDHLQHILCKHENVLEKAVDEILNNMNEDDQDFLNDLFFGISSQILKTKKQKKNKKMQNIPLNQWDQYNTMPEYPRLEHSSSTWGSIVPDIEWLANIFEISKKQAVSIYHQCSMSLPKSIYTLLSSDSMIERMNKSFVMLQPDYMSNLDQLKSQFPFLEEYMYERILLSANNDVSKARHIILAIHPENFGNSIHASVSKSHESNPNTVSHFYDASPSCTDNYTLYPGYCF